MKTNNILFVFILLKVFLLSANSSNAQIFDWRHIAKGADTAEIYITCAWYQDTQQWWGGIFRSTNNGESFTIQKKYNYPQEEREIFGDSTEGALFQFPYTGGIGISYDYGATFESRSVPQLDYLSGIGGCTSGEFYFTGQILPLTIVIYHMTNFGDSSKLIGTFPDSLNIREPGSIPGEVYAIQWPYYGGQSDTLGLALSIDSGKTFTVNYLDTSIVGYLRHHTLASGPAPGELYLAASDNSAWYHILHSVDYGQTFEEKYSFLFDPLWYTYSFIAGRLPGTFYIFEEGICSTVPLHNCITIYFSRDYGATYTAYYHELDSTFTGIQKPPPLEGTFAIYPNPATDKVTVEFEGLQETCLVELLEPMGKPVATRSRQPDEASVEIPVGQLPSGIYILRLRSGNRVLGVEKVVVE
jgi:hypothetical protein